MNRKIHDPEEDRLVWRERMLELSTVYLGVPGGFADREEADEEARRLAGERAAYEAGRVPSFEEEAMSRWRQFGTGNSLPFIGRERELTAIRETFATSGGPVILYGIGGIGKTAIAAEYARRYGETYEQVLTLTCQDSLEELFCDDSLLPVRGMRYRRDKYRSRSRYFNRKMQEIHRICAVRRTLMIIDDWSQQDARRQRIICSLPCDLLITTRFHPSLWQSGSGIEVGAFESREEWDAFCRALGAEGNRQDLEHLRHQTGGHTLSIIFAARSGIDFLSDGGGGRKAVQGDAGTEEL